MYQNRGKSMKITKIVEEKLGENIILKRGGDKDIF